jgi:hypothetical protein
MEYNEINNLNFTRGFKLLLFYYYYYYDSSEIVRHGCYVLITIISHIKYVKT